MERIPYETVQYYTHHTVTLVWHRNPTRRTGAKEASRWLQKDLRKCPKAVPHCPASAVLLACLCLHPDTSLCFPDGNGHTLVTAVRLCPAFFSLFLSRLSFLLPFFSSRGDRETRQTQRKRTTFDGRFETSRGRIGTDSQQRERDKLLVDRLSFPGAPSAD